MNKLNEPVGNTCPDINKYIKEIESTFLYIRGFNDIDDISTLKNLLNDCETTLSNAIDNFESIRKDNEKLRDWGKTLSETVSNIINEVSDYE